MNEFHRGQAVRWVDDELGVNRIVSYEGHSNHDRDLCIIDLGDDGLWTVNRLYLTRVVVNRDCLSPIGDDDWRRGDILEYRVRPNTDPSDDQPTMPIQVEFLGWYDKEKGMAYVSDPTLKAMTGIDPTVVVINKRVLHNPTRRQS